MQRLKLNIIEEAGTEDWGERDFYFRSNDVNINQIIYPEDFFKLRYQYINGPGLVPGDLDFGGPYYIDDEDKVLPSIRFVYVGVCNPDDNFIKNPGIHKFETAFKNLESF